MRRQRAYLIHTSVKSVTQDAMCLNMSVPKFLMHFKDCAETVCIYYNAYEFTCDAIHTERKQQEFGKENCSKATNSSNNPSDRCLPVYKNMQHYLYQLLRMGLRAQYTNHRQCQTPITEHITCITTHRASCRGDRC